MPDEIDEGALEAGAAAWGSFIPDIDMDADPWGFAMANARAIILAYEAAKAARTSDSGQWIAGGYVLRENVAEIIYEAMTWAFEHAESGKPPAWVEKGNSTAQEEARKAARKFFDLTPLALAKPVQVNWIKWEGGPCPVSPETKVTYLLRGSAVMGNLNVNKESAGSLRWQHTGERDDIVLYHVVPTEVPYAAAVATRRVRHKKRGGIYDVLGEAIGQVSTNADGTPVGLGLIRGRMATEGAKLTIYRDPKDGRLFWRFPDEFADGRFEPVADTVPRCGTCGTEILPDPITGTRCACSPRSDAEEEKPHG